MSLINHRVAELSAFRRGLRKQKERDTDAHYGVPGDFNASRAPARVTEITASRDNKSEN